MKTLLGILPTLRFWPTGIAVLFTASVAVNLALVTVAFRQGTELVREDYYGAASTARVNDAAGWVFRTRCLSADSAGMPAVEIVASERDGQPCDSLTGSAAFHRPSAKSLDVKAIPLRFVGRGRYLLILPRPLEHGAWQVVMNASRQSQTATRRMNLFVEH